MKYFTLLPVLTGQQGLKINQSILAKEYPQYLGEEYGHPLFTQEVVGKKSVSTERTYPLVAHEPEFSNPQTGC